MASAMIGGLVAGGTRASDIRVVEIDAGARARLEEKFGVKTTERVGAPAEADEVIVFAVKPQQISEAARSSGVSKNRNLVISIAAGVRLSTLSRRLGGYRRMIRAMPNTPALIGAGITGLYPMSEQDVTPGDRANAETIMKATGEVVWIEHEGQMDIVTAVSGSGPAYVFWMIEQLARDGEALGLPRQTADKLALQTVLGAAKLAAGSADSPATLRERVTSKGGTTEAALKVFEKEALAERFKRAIEAASKRGAELGEEMGKD